MKQHPLIVGNFHVRDWFNSVKDDVLREALLANLVHRVVSIASNLAQAIDLGFTWGDCKVAIPKLPFLVDSDGDPLVGWGQLYSNTHLVECTFPGLQSSSYFINQIDDIVIRRILKRIVLERHKGGIKCQDLVTLLDHLHEWTGPLGSRSDSFEEMEVIKKLHHVDKLTLKEKK